MPQPRARRLHPAALLVWLLLACTAPQAGRPIPLGEPRLDEQASGTEQLLQAVSVVDTSVVWVSGHGGTWARTTDGGRTWQAAVVPGAETLQFRDVHAADARTAWLLAAGSGEMSRIYRTGDAGTTWTLQWTNEEPEGFYDCLDFWDARRGFVYGDAVAGGLRVLVTEDGGSSWRRVPGSALPPALPGEGGFAASGTCAAAGAGGRGWIAAGNAERARVFFTTDYGESWQAADAPVVGGEGAGLTSISMADERRGTAFGGHITDRSHVSENLARTEDGGRSWRALPRIPADGAIYGGVHVPGTGGRALVALGPGGALVSLDDAASWIVLDNRAWWGVGSGGPDATWITGPEGRIARVRLR